MTRSQYRTFAAWLFVAAAALIGYGQFFNTFAVPYPDFFQYREHALWYQQGQLPEYFKRLPLFPLLIALLSPFMPGAEPELLTAELINLCLAPVCLWLLYRIAARFLSAAASAVVVMIFAVNRIMVYSVAQPNVEIILLATVLLTIDLSLRGSRWAYVAAFAASLTRFDAAWVIPCVMIQDWRSHPVSRRGRILLWGLLASLGALVWLALSFRHSSYVVTYAEELATRSGDPSAFLKGALHGAADILPGLSRWPAMWVQAAKLGEIVLLVIGFAVLLRRHRTGALVLLLFLGAYSLTHALFPAYLDRYALPILWIVYLVMAAAVERAAELLALPKSRAGLVITACLAGVMVSASATSATRFMRSDVVTRRATFRSVGAWYREAARPGDALVTTLWRLVGYYSGLPQQVLYAGTLKARSTDGLLAELAEKGVTYLVWDSLYSEPDSFDARRHQGYLLTQLIKESPERLEPVKRFQSGREEAIVYRLRSTKDRE